MSSLPWLYFLYALGKSCVASCSSSSADETCVTSVKEVEEQEYREATRTSVELLQMHRAIEQVGVVPENTDKVNEHLDIKAYGGDHRYLLLRPCERFAGDGRSGLPRHLVTGECCGDGICSTARFEEFETCPRDCKEGETSHMLPGQSSKVLPPTQSTLFGELEGIEHNEYHCESMYDDEDRRDECSSWVNRPSDWLEDLLQRQNNGTLPFDLPGPGSIVVEFGAGEGQDSRNMASIAGWAVTAVDVSASAIEIAKNATSPEMMGNGSGQIEFVAYDATAVPAPKKRVDFMFDATVYCGLRHLYLNKLYNVWSRVATPGHTLVNIQCWNEESLYYKAIPKTRRDMEADFEPIFDILHSEACQKNQRKAGWCFYMKLKSPEVRKQSFEERLRIQLAARNGDIEFVRQKLGSLSENMQSAELTTLYYIALSNWHEPLMKYLRPMLPKEEDDDRFLKIVYGDYFETETIKAEDQRDGGESKIKHGVLEYMRTDWERAESQLILEDYVGKLMLEKGISSNNTLTTAHEFMRYLENLSSQ